MSVRGVTGPSVAGRWAAGIRIYRASSGSKRYRAVARSVPLTVCEQIRGPSSIEDSVGEGRIAEVFMPMDDLELAGDQGCLRLCAIAPED